MGLHVCGKYAEKRVFAGWFLQEEQSAMDRLRARCESPKHNQQANQQGSKTMQQAESQKPSDFVKFGTTGI